MNTTTPSARWHTLVVRVENKPGVLARVAGLFSRRGFNIDSLAVAPTDDERFSRISIAVDAESTSIDQIVKQLDKLINVVDIRELDPGSATERELMLATVSIGADDHAQLEFPVSGFDLTILERNDTAVTLSFSGMPERVDQLEDYLEKWTIIEIQRTGKIALPKI